MNRRRFLTTLNAAAATGLAGCGTEETAEAVPRVGPDGFTVSSDGTRVPFRIRGVNVGMSKPGHFPGDAAITHEEYARWFRAIDDLNANAVRVYTIHPPAFYRALAAHNRDAADPLYLFQGTWLPVADLVAAGDATATSPSFRRALRRTVDVVHGATTLPDRPGRASGTYDADVSDYLLGYVAGVEWPPAVVRATNEAGTDGSYSGQFLETQGASPFEGWLAESLDALVAHETETYGTQRPVAFTNWPTTDPLDHPYEPFPGEDSVSVDPDAVRATAAFDAGTFAAYHAYPYYPDFLNESPDYVTYVDHRGEPNSYAGYLADLVGSTDQPLLVAEFGVPSSRGIAHEQVHGRDHGNHTEREQGRLLRGMYEDVLAAGTLGGLVFAWQDEWFKRTWNVADYSLPSRRPQWANRQSPEECYGLLAFDPAGRVRLDGTAADWADAQTATTTAPQTPVGDGADGARRLTSLAVTHDAAALSIRLEFEALPAPVDWSATNAVLTLGFTGRGNETLPWRTEAAVPPTDFVVRLGGPGDSRVLVDTYYDVFAREYGVAADLDLARYREPAGDRFGPIRLAVNRGYTVPPTGESVPFQSVETGRLRYGNANPASSAYDSLADVHVAPEADAVELRLPWGLLNVADPSSRQVLGDVWTGGLDDAEEISGIDIAAATYAPDGNGDARPVGGSTNLTHALPTIRDGRLGTVEYTWEAWNEPAYEERTKRSYAILRDAFAAAAGR